MFSEMESATDTFKGRFKNGRTQNKPKEHNRTTDIQPSARRTHPNTTQRGSYKTRLEGPAANWNSRRPATDLQRTNKFKNSSVQMPISDNS